MKRPKYTRALKVQFCKEFREGDETLKEICARYKVSTNTVRSWLYGERRILPTDAQRDDA